MGGVHLNAYANIPGAEVVGVADANRESAVAGAELVGARPYASYGELVAAEDVEVVDVCLPTAFHRDLAVRAAGEGRHVILEKPIARTIEDAQEILDSFSGAGPRLFVGHVVRPASLRAQAIEHGIACAADQPSPDRTLRRVEARRVLEKVQEHLLRDILGEGSRLRHCERKPVDVVAPAAVQRDERGLCSSGARRDVREQRGVGRVVVERRCVVHVESLWSIYAGAAARVPSSSDPRFAAKVRLDGGKRKKSPGAAASLVRSFAKSPP